MLLDTLNGLHTLHEDFAAFLVSSTECGEFRGATSGSPAPYDEFLHGLRVAKTRAETSLHLAHDRWLELLAPREALEGFARQLLVPEDGDHNHWYGRPLSLVIEADESWPGPSGRVSGRGDR